MGTDEYSMGMIAKLCKVSKATLVRWENNGIIKPKPKRLLRNNARVYTEEHKKQIETYKTAIKDESEPKKKK